MKKTVCTTLPLRDRAMFVVLSYKKYGYGKGSVQKGMIDAVRDWNAKMLSQTPEPKQEALFNEIRELLARDVKEYRNKEKAR